MSSHLHHDMRTYIDSLKRAIRAECTRQDIDDDARRALMQRLAGVTTSTALDEGGARKVLAHLHAAGGQSALAPRRDDEWSWVNGVSPAKQRLLWKIRRICINLGIAAGSQARYCEGVAARVSGHERHLRMMDAGELWVLIGPLERTARYKRQGDPEPAA